MRALWIHHPDDTPAVARGDEYLWGPNILVAPVTDTRFTARAIYLPARALVRVLVGASRWMAAANSSGRSIWRPCRSTFAPARSCPWARSSNTRMKRSTVRSRFRSTPAPTANSWSTKTTAFPSLIARGDWMGLDLRWDDKAKRLSIELAEGSRMRPPLDRQLELRVMPDGKAPHRRVFTGKKLEVTL